MKYVKTIAVATALACAALTSRADVLLSFNNTSGATITFGGGSFQFVPSGGTDFRITGSSGADDSFGDTGTISGVYTIGTVTPVAPGIQSAPVTGSGTLTINDGLGKSLTAGITWDTIESIGAGTSDTLNFGGTINLTSVNYNGTLTDLKDLAQNHLGIAVLNFTFTSSSAQDVQHLKTFSGSEKSFSGSLSSAVPEPTTVVAGALLLLPFGLSAFRVLRKNSSTAPLS